MWGEEEAPRSVSLRLGAGAGGALDDLLGTHLLVSPERGRGNRKRWFVRVGLHQEPQRAPVEIDLRDVELTACRAGGPGGQHVNKTSSAVRARHLPSGIAVRSEGQRSRTANR